ncbi:predicted protein [Uncinocarpus reesii 1704]|uniref:PH domain-containing protein n=1 Tax=Uncinocarpus reesii (strain UAMH 1704) TaxID=336963 RepID=C4JXP8_UNCRE|nr:uncharacterized protein UREG_06421 [Uncinocarpus reesii 1704]EEP81556.1 predicted protein [Uncinocarpus reesii 1704]
MDLQQQPPPTGFRTRPKLPPIQTTLNKRASMRPKPPPPEQVTGSTPTERVPLKEPRTLTSKSSLRSFINKTRAMRRNSSKNDNSPSPIAEWRPVTNDSPVSNHQITPTSADRAPKAVKSSSAPAVPSLANSPSLNTTPKLSKSVKERKRRTIPAWEPPPLFKAYPQAIKHATLLAPNIPAETILRIQALARQEDQEASSETDVKETKDQRQARKAADSIHHLEWTRKIYMLVTSGYLLQYNADGNFDRLPELILELGETSVAFASDAVPGKHWVLQISQTFDENGTATVDNKKSFLSRLRISDSPKLAKSLLLVLDSAEDLSAWLFTMRREIEGLSGKEYVPETPMIEETPLLHRYQSMASMQRPPQHSFTNRSSLSVSSTTLSPSSQTRLEGLAALQANRRSMARSVETPSPSITATSDSDRIKDNYRLSCVSIGTRTIPSSCGSSPPSSSAGTKHPIPKNSFLSSPESMASVASIESSTRPIPIIRGPAYFRREPILPDKATSNAVVSSQTPKPPLMPAPNFSVPAFSKRFSSTLNLRSAQLSSSAPTSKPTPAVALGCSVYYSSETSIDTIPEDPEPVEPKRERPVIKLNSWSTPQRPSNQPRATPIRARRYSSSGHKIDIHTPISELGPESPIINIKMVQPTQDVPQYRWPLLSNASSNPRPRLPREHSTHSPQRPLSLQVGTPRVSAPEYPPLSSSTQPITIPSEAAVLNLPTAPRHPPPLPPPSQNPRKPNLSPRRSLPQMTFGPPPAPPPDCPLPEIPPVVGPRTTPTWKTIPSVTAMPTQLQIRQARASGSRQISSHVHAKAYRASVPRINAGGLNDIRPSKKQGILQAC